MDSHAALLDAMMAYERGCPQRVHHFLAVRGFAMAIAQGESLEPRTRLVLEAAAITHDIGIRPSLEKYGDASGPHQELEGPLAARPMLEKLGYPAPIADRVCRLIGKHHTVTDILGDDHQILLEADFLVNALSYADEAVRDMHDKVFKTDTGRRLLRTLYMD